MAVTEKGMAKIRAILQQDTLTRDEVEELCRLGNVGGKWPASDGIDEHGEPYWERQTFTRWAQRDAIQYRSGGTRPAQLGFRHAPPIPRVQTRVQTAERASVRSKTWNEDDRTFQAVIASETRVPMIDFASGELINEVLEAGGMQHEEIVPLQTDHERKVTATAGSFSGFRRDGSTWIATGRLARTPAGDSLAALIRDGHARAVSVGYRIVRFTIISPGREETIGGRRYVADPDRALRVVTEWILDEVSVVFKGADPTALIRGDQLSQARGQNMPFVHSRNSVTEQPTIGELVSAAMMAAGCDDPSQHRGEALLSGVLCRLAPSSVTVQDAERGYALRNCDWHDLLLQAARLDQVRGVREFGVSPYELVRALYGHYSRNYSTANIDALFTSTFASMFLVGWDQAGDSTDGWCGEVENLSTKVTERLRLSGGELHRRPRGEQAEHTTLVVVSEDTQATAFSAMFNIDEQDVIDGAVGEMLQTIPIQLAGAARALRPDMVYAYLARNEDMADGNALFDETNHGNDKTSAALAEDKLLAAQAAMAKQVEGAVKLNLRGQWLIVPEAVERTAAKLARDVELMDERAQKPAVVRSDSRLDLGVTDPLTDETHAGNATRWYLAAGTHGVEVQYLAGFNKLPQVRSFVLTQGRFGWAFDVQHYVGCKAVDWRGLVRNST